jgi:hypothetical protein
VKQPYKSYVQPQGYRPQIFGDTALGRASQDGGAGGSREADIDQQLKKLETEIAEANSGLPKVVFVCCKKRVN